MRWWQLVYNVCIGHPSISNLLYLCSLLVPPLITSDLLSGTCPLAMWSCCESTFGKRLFMLALLVRQTRGFVSPRRSGLAATCRFLSDKRRLSEFDHLFFETPSSSPSPTPSRPESTSAGIGAYDYDPAEDDEPEMDSNILMGVDDAPPQSSAWEDATPRPSAGGQPPTRPDVLQGIEPPRRQKKRTEMLIPLDRDDLFIKSSNGGPTDSSLDQLLARLKELEQAIYTKNNGKKFNINSPKQVSTILFGNADQSTNKDVLETMGGAGNIMADLIFQHRQRKQEIKRMERKETVASSGKTVTAFSKTVSETETNSNDPLLLVDASAYIFRAYFSMPPLHRGDGMPVGAVMGFCNMLNRLILTRMLAGESPRLVLVYDAKGKNFRHDLYPEYKANRPERPMDLIPQFDLIREAATAYGIPGMEATGFEADDVIATLATLALAEGIDTHILTGDKDLMQLVTSPGDAPYVHMIDPMSMSRIDHDAVVEKWGVPPELIGDILALAGDAADNIPGVPGIGPKIAATLLEEYGSLEGVFEQVDNVKQKARREKLIENQHLAVLSRQLVELERSIPLERLNSIPTEMINVRSLRMEPIDGDRLLKFYDTMGFRTLKRQVSDRLTQQEGKTERQVSDRLTQQEGKTERQVSDRLTQPEVKTERQVPDRLTQPEVKTKRKKSTWTPRPKAQVPKPEDYSDVPF